MTLSVMGVCSLGNLSRCAAFWALGRVLLLTAVAADSFNITTGPSSTNPTNLGEHPCDHNDIGIVVREERATRLAFDAHLEDQNATAGGGVIDQVRKLNVLSCSASTRSHACCMHTATRGCHSQ